ncbi:glycoside hydrolase family 108 protein [Roseomonas elaeocarpi]|uniref:Glycoside hydrolase family 108 protein n=1 Tax=Roseomonas elaeocarpi TaxID=907779 RepID=A0ABV6JSK5_9PROT
MDARFLALIEPQVAKEGGYSNNPADRGGETIWGITAARARAAGYTGPMATMPRATALDIYGLYYWRQPMFDQIDAIDPGVGEKMLEIGINMGTGRAGQFLQRILNVMNGRGSLWADLKVDGVCGAMTRAAMNSFIQRRGAQGRRVLLEALIGLQCEFYIGLAEGDVSQEDFVYGWIANRVVNV